jgi:hypothetical protein
LADRFVAQSLQLFCNPCDHGIRFSVVIGEFDLAHSRGPVLDRRTDLAGDQVLAGQIHEQRNHGTHLSAHYGKPSYSLHNVPIVHRVVAARAATDATGNAFAEVRDALELERLAGPGDHRV